MRNKVALLVIYNHRYDKNIPVIEKLYHGRFSHIFHIVPFYDGTIKNVIPVYESSYYFQGYIAQAYQHIKDQGYTHFYVIADDMVLNPVINENALWDTLGLAEDECFLPGYLILQERKEYWGHAKNAIAYSPRVSGVEAISLLPTDEEAANKFKALGLPVGEINESILHNPQRKTLKQSIKQILGRKQNLHLKYPIVGGYSDTFIVTADVMPKFINYCGIFAATRLFVELAIPTAMVLSAKKIKLGKNLRLHGKAIWEKDDIRMLEDKYNRDIKKLLEDFPSELMYLHPVKLSKWYKQ